MNLNMLDMTKLNAKVIAEMKDGETCCEVQGNATAAVFCAEAVLTNIMISVLEDNKMTAEEMLSGLHGMVDMAYRRVKKGGYERREVNRNE